MANNGVSDLGGTVPSATTHDKPQGFLHVNVKVPVPMPQKPGMLKLDVQVHLQHVPVSCDGVGPGCYQQPGTSCSDSPPDDAVTGCQEDASMSDSDCISRTGSDYESYLYPNGPDNSGTETELATLDESESETEEHDLHIGIMQKVIHPDSQSTQPAQQEDLNKLAEALNDTLNECLPQSPSSPPFLCCGHCPRCSPAVAAAADTCAATVTSYIVEEPEDPVAVIRHPAPVLVANWAAMDEVMTGESNN